MTNSIFLDGSCVRPERVYEQLEELFQTTGRSLYVVFPGACASRCWLDVRRNYLRVLHSLPGSADAERIETECAAHPRVSGVVPSREPGSFWQKLKKTDPSDALFVASDDATGATSFLLSMAADTRVKEIACFTSTGQFGFSMMSDDAEANRRRIQGDLIRAILRGECATVPGLLMDNQMDVAVPETDDIVAILRDECVPSQREFVKRVSGNTATDVTGFLVDWLFQGDTHAYSRCVDAYVDIIPRVIESYRRMEFGADLLLYPFDVAPGAADVLMRIAHRGSSPPSITKSVPIRAHDFLMMVGRADQLPPDVQDWVPAEVTGSHPATGLPRVPFRRRIAAAIISEIL